MLGTRTRLHISLCALALLLVACPATAEDASAPVPHDGPSLIGFLFENYYESDLVELSRRASWISEYDLAVALHLERASGVTLDEIVTWRRQGSSWDAITRRCGLGCEVFFVELTDAETLLPDPYARPYVTWDEHPGADQRLSDIEIRELVLLRAMSDYCGASADEIVKLRAAGHSPKAIAAVHPPRPRREAVSTHLEKLSLPSDPVDVTSEADDQH